MQSFAVGGSAGRGRPGSSQGQRPSSRQERAANARVQIKREGPMQYQPQQQQQRVAPAQQNTHQAMRRSSGNNGHLTAPPPQTQSNLNVRGEKRDGYDTDADSLDTTLPPRSMAHIMDSQQTQPLHGDYPDQENYDDVDDGGSDEEADFAEQHDDNDDWDDEQYNFLEQNNALEVPRMQQENLLRSVQLLSAAPEDGDSYPTTTSGVPDDFPQGFEAADDDIGPYENDDLSRVSPTPQSRLKTALLQHVPNQPLQRPVTSAQTVQPMSGASSYFQKAGNLRGQNRSDSHLLATTNGHNAAIPQGKPSQPQNQSTAATNRDRAVKVNLQQAPVEQNSGALPQRGGGASQPRGNRAPQGGQAAQVKGPVQIKVPTPEPLEEEPTQDEEDHGPIEDYEQDALFRMDYRQLKDESFDTNPRADPPVLSEDMNQKPLNERLKHVQERLDDGDQAKFLSSLSTAEWEEAGDWFLDQFQSIINRTKEARQTKRKLAREFEDEVEKRHKHVSKKRTVVEQALDKMKAHGQGLIPKSPRASKSPRPSKSPKPQP